MLLSQSELFCNENSSSYSVTVTGVDMAEHKIIHLNSETEENGSPPLADALPSSQWSENYFQTQHSAKGTDPHCLPNTLKGDQDDTQPCCCRTLGAELRRRRTVAYVHRCAPFLSTHSVKRTCLAAFIDTDIRTLAEHLWSENETDELLPKATGNLSNRRRVSEITPKGTTALSSRSEENLRDKGISHARSRIKSLSVPMSGRRVYRCLGVLKKYQLNENMLFEPEGNCSSSETQHPA